MFVSSYSDATIWVEQRDKKSFVVKSSIPNAQFAWEIKGKRRGYENVRLKESTELKYDVFNNEIEQSQAQVA